MKQGAKLAIILMMISACTPKSVPDDTFRIVRQNDRGFLAYVGFDYGYNGVKSRLGDYCEMHGKKMRALTMRIMKERGWIVEGDCL